ncbi:MAG: hypothetical protein J6W64_09225, partial [Bacilli bacterium]|nr:hypothetical protein [Bacilli bacterium]
MTVQMLTQIVDIALIVIFALVIIFTLISAIIGFKNGVFRTTHRMIILIILFVIAACTLTPTTHLVELIPLTWLPNMRTIIIERTFDNGDVVSYFAPVTNLRDTLISALKGYYQLYGIAGSSSRATALALAMAGTVIKLITFFIDAFLIVTLGGIFEIILWHILGKHLIPKLV